ncbi:MAG: type II secretion system F family protein, partial [Candidatus Eremiobacteraeota bacterium]|nr:type II secretion system F family protein [Candidatus Eremiobacteraeota bacterium]
MVTFGPTAILLGAAAAIIFFVFALWNNIHERAEKPLVRLQSLLERSGLYRKHQDYVGIWLVTSAVVWLLLELMIRPGPIGSVLLLPASALLTAGAARSLLTLLVKRRNARFVDQLELALRLMASGLRAGLGIRQSLSLVVDEMPSPAHEEFARIVGQTNLGASLSDALDDFAARMPCGETLMMARVIRIQSRTGGDLGRILEHLANTIRDRRRIGRKISSLT